MTVRHRLGASARGTPRVPPIAPAPGSIPVADLVPGSNGQELMTLGGVAAWAFDPSDTTVVANIAALEALAGLENGQTAYTLSLKSYWTFHLGSALTTDGITIVADVGATGKWVRSLVPDESWAFQAAWFLNATTGNDENAGSTSLTALKTAAELTRRINGQTLHQTTTVTQSTDLAEYVDLTVTLVSPSDQFFWFADPAAITTVFTGSGGLSAVTAIDASTNTPQSITDTNTGGLNWNSWLGAFRIRITTVGARQNAVGYVAKVLSNTHARVTPFTVFDPITGSPLAAANVTPLVGDHYVVETLPGVFGMNLFVNRAGSNLTNQIAGAVDSINLGKGVGTDSGVSIDCSVGTNLLTVSRCIMTAGRISGFNCSLAATFFTGTTGIADVFFITGGGAVLTTVFGFGQKVPFSSLQGDFLLNGGAFLVPENHVTLGAGLGGVGIFDATQAAIFMHEEQDAALVTINDSGSVASTVYGSNNLYGVDLCGSHQINYEIVAPKVTGNNGDIHLGNDIFSWVQTPVINAVTLAGVTNRAGINSASIYRTGLGTAVTDTNVFTSSPPSKGLYQVVVYLAVTTAGAAGDQASVTLKWQDDSQAETVVVINAVSVVAKGFFTVAQYVETDGAHAVTYALSFPVKTGAPQLSLRIVATPLQSANV